MPCNPSRSSGRAHRGVVKAVGVSEALLGELVDIWRFGVLRSVATDPGDAVVLAGDPEQIGAVLRLCRKEEEEQAGKD